MTRAAAPAVIGDDWLVPPLRSMSEGWFRKLMQPANTAAFASQEAKLESPGATRSTVLPVWLKPPELSVLMLLFSQPVLAKSSARA